jgi:ribonuclease HI
LDNTSISISVSHCSEKKKAWLTDPRSAADYNLFVDAGCFLDGSTGWGLIIYDRTGAVDLSACKLDPLLAEALGVRWCLQTAVTLNLQQGTISSDAATVVKCLNSNLCIANKSIILDCELLMEQLGSVNVCHVRRHLNVVSHNLAKLSKSVGSKTWMGYVSSQVQATVSCINYVVIS